jgi:putative transposase
MMTRLARMVVAALPHHVTQRGNRREAIFFEDGDHEIYRDLLAEQTRKAGVEVWAYCLMPNHVQAHLMAAVCYVSLNPVRARLVSHAEDWPWSSARAHLAGADDNLVTVRPVLNRTSCFADLSLEDRGEDFAALRRSEGSGRPVGTAEFVTGLERLLGRPIARRAPGPKPANSVDGPPIRIAVIGILSPDLPSAIHSFTPH